MEGPGVVGGEETMGGGVIETDREMWGMTMFGRACQKEEAATTGRGAATGRLMGALMEVDAIGWKEDAVGAFSRTLLVDRAREISLSSSLLLSRCLPLSCFCFL